MSEGVSMRLEKETTRTYFDPKADSPLLDTELTNLKKRYKKFDASTVAHEVVQEILGGKVISVSAIPESRNAMDHVVYSARVRENNVETELILRVNVRKEVAEYFKVESALYALMHSIGIRTPEIKGVHLRTKTLPYDVMLLTRVGTQNLEAYQHERQDEHMRVSHAAGAFLAQIHQLSLPGFGPITLGEDAQLGGVYGDWKTAIMEGVSNTLGYLYERGIIDATIAEESRSAFIRHARLLTQKNGVLLHGDYHPANILVEADTGEIAGAVDLTQAKVGDPAFDIAFYSTYVDADSLIAFLEGYEAARGAIIKRGKRLALYRLRILLSKAKLRKRFGYDDRIAAAVTGIQDALVELR